MMRCRILAAHLWAWGCETGWKMLDPVLYEDREEPVFQGGEGFVPFGGGD